MGGACDTVRSGYCVCSQGIACVLPGVAAVACRPCCGVRLTSILSTLGGVGACQNSVHGHMVSATSHLHQGWDDDPGEPGVDRHYLACTWRPSYTASRDGVVA